MAKVLPSTIARLRARIEKSVRESIAAQAAKKSAPKKAPPDEKRPSPVDLPPIKNEDEDADDDLELDEDAEDEDAEDEDAGDPPFKKKKASQAIADRAAAIEMRRAAARSLGISERKFAAAAVPPISNAFTPVDRHARRNRSESADAKVIREITNAGQLVREAIVANLPKKK